jgi:peroxiredoxin Q/BCP
MKPAALALLLSLAVAAPAFAADAPKVGDAAPGFVMPYATRDSVARDSLSLAGLAGARNVVLAFYPADWSGGCTREVCTLRDNFAALAALDAEIVGISGDYVFSHREWAKHHDLPFRLASDHRHDVARAYGSFNEASGFNRRTVYVVGRDGRIAYADPAYSVRDAASFEKLKAALAEMMREGQR